MAFSKLEEDGTSSRIVCWKGFNTEGGLQGVVEPGGDGFVMDWTL